MDPKATPEDGYIYSDGLFDTIDKLGLPAGDLSAVASIREALENSQDDDAESIAPASATTPSATWCRRR